MDALNKSGIKIDLDAVGPTTTLYSSVTCSVAHLSDIKPDTAEKLIGKTIARIDAGEYRIKITFTDGSSLTASGATYGDCALGIDVGE